MGCDKEVNVTIRVGNESYPIHPLDATMPYSDLGLSGDGCVGTVCNAEFYFPMSCSSFLNQFQPITTAVGPDFDIILGMAAST